MSRGLGIQPWHGLLIFVILCVKLPFLFAYGPTISADGWGYISYASGILSGHHPTLAVDGLADDMVFRVAGYPALIAIAMILAGAAWQWVIVALQISFTLLVAIMIGHLVKQMTGSVRWALGAGVIYATSLPLALDQMILTDSLAGSLLALPACLLAMRVHAGRRLSVGVALGLGLIVAAAFLMREATVYFAGLGLLPMALAAAFADRLPLRGLSVLRQQAWKRCFTALVIILPMLGCFQAYRLWNQARFGVPFVTTASQTALFYALATVAEAHPEILDRDRLVDRVAADTFRTFDFEEVWIINRRLYSEHGLTSDKIATAAYGSYFNAWRREPLLMLRIPLHHIRPSFARAWLQPVRSALLLNTWATRQDREPSLWRAMVDGQWRWAPLFVLDALCMVVAIPVFLAFLFVAPLRLLREGVTRDTAIAMGFWAIFVAFYGGYAMVHLEARYLIGALAGVTVIGMLHLHAAWRWLMALRGGRRLERGDHVD